MLFLLYKAWFRFRFLGLTVIFISIIMDGCVSSPKPLPAGLRAQFGKVGVLSTTSPPQLKFKTFAKRLDAGAAKGAAGGAFILGIDAMLSNPELLELLLSSQTSPLGGLLLLPFIGVGVLGGSIYGASHSVPKKTADMIEKKLIETLNDRNLSSSIADSIYLACNTRSEPNKYSIIKLDAYEHDYSAVVKENDKLGVKTILSVNVIEAGFLGGKGKHPETMIYMIVRAQVINTDDGTKVFERDFEYLSEELPYDKWFVDNSKKFKQKINQAVRSLSERIVDEIFIAPFFPFKDAPLFTMIGKPEYGSCWFYPIYPQVQYDSFLTRLAHHEPFIKPLFTKIDSLQPTLKWEPFPRPRDCSPKNEEIISAISEVEYDLQLWDTENNAPEHLVCYRSGLKDPQYNMEFPLKPDAKYFWTFRARYKLYGNPQTTRWAFSLQPQYSLPPFYPCETDFIPNENYYRFITPSEKFSDTNPIFTEKEPKNEKKDGDLSSNKIGPKIASTGKQKKIAILPFHFYKGNVKYGDPIKDPTIEAIGQALKTNNNYYLTYSYYNVADESGVRVFDEEFISISSPEELWTDKIFRPITPNMDLSCKIGKKLGVDILLLVSVVAANQYAYDTDFYLINVLNRKIYKRSSQIHASRYNSEIESFTRLFFSSYSMTD